MATSLSRIILTGFMGSGKTTVGRKLAARLSWNFCDSDDEIAAARGCSIREIFAHEGEAAFRGYESHRLGELLRAQKTVIATGGGVVLEPQNLARLAGEIGWVTLLVSPEVAFLRVGDDPSRPLLAGQKQFAELLQRRAPLYRRAPHQIDTDARTPEEVVQSIFQELSLE